MARPLAVATLISLSVVESFSPAYRKSPARAQSRPNKSSAADGYSGISRMLDTPAPSTEMGAQMDPGATTAFAFIFVVFGLLRFTISNSMRAQDDYLRGELELQEAKVDAVDGTPGSA